jgi:hypothetical protein
MTSPMTSPTPTLSSPINPFSLNRSIRQLSDTNGGGGRIRHGSIVTSVVTPTLSRLRKRRRLEVPVGAPLVLPLPNLPPAAAMPCKKYHQETSLVLDYDRSNLDRKHVIIPFDQLISFLDYNFVCKKCGKSKSTYQRQCVGIATSINWFCCCMAGGSIKARLRNTGDDDATKDWENSTFTRLKPTNSFELNTRFVLGLQQCGGGVKDAAVHAAMLDLAVDPFHNSWQKIEEEILVAEVALGKQIVGDNIKLEAKMTIAKKKVLVAEYLHNPFKYRATKYDPLTAPGLVSFLKETPESELTYSSKVKDKKLLGKLICKPCTPFVPERRVANANKTGLSVQGDCRWDQRKGGRAYNSDSGTHILVGNASMKCVAMECMSRRCAKCESNKQHPTYLCSKNYEGSSKGMEAEGALRNVRLLYEAHDVFIETFVMDDDSSTKSILRHSWSELIHRGVLDKLDWPKTPSNRKKDDHGRLPFLHPILDFLADQNHRVQTYASYFFKLSKLSRKITQCTANDAERMKRNFAYFLHMYRKHPFHEFQKAGQAVLEHHFNNHELCGDWCPANKWQGEDKDKMLKYRCKKINAKLYEQMKQIHDIYTEPDNLRDIWHEVHSNKCESLNGFITKFLPKHKHYCRTIVNRGRSYLAIVIDSVGYQKYYRILWKMLCLEPSTTVIEHHRRLDQIRLTMKVYHASPEAKKKRKHIMNNKLREAAEKLIKDKKEGKNYGTNLAGPQVDVAAIAAPGVVIKVEPGVDVADVVIKVEPGVNDNNNKQKKKKAKQSDKARKPTPTCKFCHIVGHERKTNKNCMLSVNPGSKNYRPENAAAPREFVYCDVCLCILILHA